MCCQAWLLRYEKVRFCPVMHARLEFSGFPLLLSSAYSRGQQSFVLFASPMSAAGGESKAPAFAPSAVH